MRRILLDTDTCIEIIRGRPTPFEDYAEASFGVELLCSSFQSGLRQ